MKCAARSTGRHSRRCLWHQYGPRCGSRGKSRSKCVVSPAERAARARTTARTCACSYSRARERVEHVLARPEVAGQEYLDQLRDELAQVRVQRVHVTRALALREVALGPRQLEVDGGVQRFLRRRHAPPFYGAAASPGRSAPGSTAERCRGCVPGSSPRTSAAPKAVA